MQHVWAAKWPGSNSVVRVYDLCRYAGSTATGQAKCNADCCLCCRIRTPPSTALVLQLAKALCMICTRSSTLTAFLHKQSQQPPLLLGRNHTISHIVLLSHYIAGIVQCYINSGPL